MPIPNAPAWEPWLGLLQKASLFRGISPDDLCRLLLQLSPTVQRYPAGDIILLSGQENASIRIVLEGSIIASKISPGGQTVTMAHMQPGGIFGDVLSGSSTPSPVTVTAAAPCTVLALPYERLMLPGCSDAAHCVLLRNLVEAISDKYFSLCRRVDLLILKSLRAKLCGSVVDGHAAGGNHRLRRAAGGDARLGNALLQPLLHGHHLRIQDSRKKSNGRRASTTGRAARAA